MNVKVFDRLVEISRLPDSERKDAFSETASDDCLEYMRILDGLNEISVPASSASKKWAGRMRLMEAVESQQTPASVSWRFLTWARAAPMVATQQQSSPPRQPPPWPWRPVSPTARQRGAVCAGHRPGLTRSISGQR